MAVTWNPADKNAGISLTGSNLIATSSAGSGTVNQAVRATQAISGTTKQYFEVTVSGTVGQYLSLGVMDTSSLSGNAGIGNPGTGACLLNNGRGGSLSSIYLNATQNGSYPVLASGQVMRVAVDRGGNKAWWAINNNTWSGSNVWMDGSGAACDPSANTGGLNITTVTGTIYPAFSSAWTGDVATINGGDTAFAYAIPTGFQALTTPVVPPPNTYWNPSDRTANIALSNGGLTATASALGNAAARSVYSTASGKFYWEYTFTNNTNVACGIANGSAALGGLGFNGATGAAYVNAGGPLYVNGTTLNANLGAFANGSRACIAIDLGAQLIWMRNGAAGNWNNSGTANPATGVGGFSLVGMVGAGTPAYGLMSGNNASPSGAITANFGDSAFAGVVPAGFLAGFPGTVAASASQARVMVLA